MFQFGSQRHPRFPDNAFVRLRDTAATLDIKAVQRYTLSPQAGGRAT